MGDAADDVFYSAPDDDCDHDDYQVDILTGRAECYMCGHHWYQTEEQMRAEERLQREYDELCKTWDAEPLPPAEGGG